MNNYYQEIEQYIKRNEVNKVARKLEENQDILTNYWNIGRLIVEAQGGEKRAKYGNELIKKWSREFTEKYGKGYDYTNMSRYRKFYLTFPKIAAVRQEFTWTHLKMLLPIKEENKRNYYINLCITKNMSSRELEQEIRNNAYERLVHKPERIEIIGLNPKYSITSNLHNPILFELKEGERITSEHDLEVIILARLKNFFSQLGEGFALIGNQYKLTYGRRDYFIDILLFNVKLNCFIVVELKVRKLQKEDKGQVELYMKVVDETLKEPFHNKTMGIIITKEQDKFIANFVGSDSVIPLTYKTL